MFNLIRDNICHLCLPVVNTKVISKKKQPTSGGIRSNWRKNSIKYYNNNKDIISARRKLEYISRKNVKSLMPSAHKV